MALRGLLLLALLLLARPAAAEASDFEDEASLLQVSAVVPRRGLELNQTLEETQALFLHTVQQMHVSMPSSKIPSIAQLLPELLTVLRNASLVGFVRGGLGRLSRDLGGYWAGLERGVERLRGGVANATAEAQALALLRAFLQTQEQEIALVVSEVGSLLTPVLQSLPSGGELAALAEPVLRHLEQGDVAAHILATDALFGDDAHFCENLPPVFAFLNRCGEFASTSFPGFVTTTRALVSTVSPLISIMAPDIANVVTNLINSVVRFSEDMVGPMASGIQFTVSAVGDIAASRLNCTGLDVTFIGTSGGGGGSSSRGDLFWPRGAAAAPRAAAAVGLAMLLGPAFS